jgi:hypothetical protein
MHVDPTLLKYYLHKMVHRTSESPCVIKKSFLVLKPIQFSETFELAQSHTEITGNDYCKNYCSDINIVVCFFSNSSIRPLTCCVLSEFHLLQGLSGLA